MLKTKKNIKVVDISADEAVMLQVEPLVNIEKPIVDIEKPIVDIEKPIVDIEKPIVDIEKTNDDKPVVENKLKKSVKTTDLTECEKCHKMITNRTLKYSHFKTCCIVKNTKIISTPNVIHVDESIIKPVNDTTASLTINKPITAIRAKSNVIKHVKSVSTFKPPVIADNKPPIITLDEMRRQYLNNATQQHIQRTSALFANAF